MKAKYGRACLQLLFDKEAIVVPVEYTCLFPAGQKLRVALDVSDQIKYLSAGVGQLRRIRIVHGSRFSKIKLI